MAFLALLGAAGGAAGGAAAAGGFLSAALPLVSAGLSIAGGIAGKRNADAEAKARRRLGAVEAEDRRRQTRRLIASQQVAFAKAGVATGAGTPLDVLGDTVAEEELAALRIRFGRESESDALKRQGDLALFKGIAGGLGTILGGVGSGAFDSFTFTNPFTSPKKFLTLDQALKAGVRNR